MPIDLAKAIGGGGGGVVPIGGEVIMYQRSGIIVEEDNLSYLRSGYIITDEQLNYPEAFSLMSTPANNWKAVIAEATNYNFFSIAANDTTIVMLCAFSTSGTESRIYYSTDDGATWSYTTSMFPGRDSYVKFLNGAFYISGLDTNGYWQVYRSVTGTSSWSGVYVHNVGPTNPHCNVHYVNETYVASVPYSNRSYITTSTNGTTWTYFGFVPNVKHICNDGTKLVASSTHTVDGIRTSTDGTTWTLVSTPPGNYEINSFDYIDGYYLLSTKKGLYVSVDLQNWSMTAANRSVSAVSKYNEWWLISASSGNGVIATKDITNAYTVNAYGAVGYPDEWCVYKGRYIRVAGNFVYESYPNSIGIPTEVAVSGGGYKYLRIK